jgi:hypothetical protein
MFSHNWLSLNSGGPEPTRLNLKNRMNDAFARLKSQKEFASTDIEYDSVVLGSRPFGEEFVVNHTVEMQNDRKIITEQETIIEERATILEESVQALPPNQRDHQRQPSGLNATDVAGIGAGTSFGIIKIPSDKVLRQ